MRSSSKRRPAPASVSPTRTIARPARRSVMTAEEAFDVAELIVKVKEPQLNECKRLRADQTLFTYLHLAADKPQAEALMASRRHLHRL